MKRQLAAAMIAAAPVTALAVAALPDPVVKES